MIEIVNAMKSKESMNSDSASNPQPTIEMSIARERLRQAHHGFNLALATTVTCALISFAGAGFVLLGKTPEGTITATGGLASTICCLRLSKDANDRLDKVAEEWNDDA
jgi:hypothetical protein